jgi:hypothetical protein
MESGGNLIRRDGEAVPVLTHHVINTCGGIEVELHDFLTSILDESESNSGTHWMCPRDGLSTYLKLHEAWLTW